MASVKLAPVFNDAQFINAIPANGALLFTYVAGSSTKQTTYTDITGTVPQANPIVLNSRGEPSSPIWLTTGQAYKFVFAPSTDTDPPTSPIRTIDNITGINDASISIDQWVSSGVTPTYVSASSFTLAGDQTTAFHVGRRLKITVTAGTVYGTISTSVFGALTTIGVTLDSGVLDAGLSAVSYGLLTNTNYSLPAIVAKSGANTDITSLSGLTTPLSVAQGGTGTNTAQVISSKIQPVTATQATGALTFGLAATTLDYRSTTLTAGTVTTVTNTALTLVLPSGGTLGAPTTIQQRLVLVAINNAGTSELAVISSTGGNDLSETGVISTTAISAASTANNVFYSTTARTGVAYRVVGAIDAVNTAGAWANPTLVQGYGGQALSAMSSLGYGQTWQSVTGSRAFSTNYYNTTGKPIMVFICGTASTAFISGQVTAQINGGSIGTSGPTSGTSGGSVTSSVCFIVPVGMYYSASANSVTLASWFELR